MCAGRQGDRAWHTGNGGVAIGTACSSADWCMPRARISQAEYQPSDLLCPTSLLWVPFQKVESVLEQVWRCGNATGPTPRRACVEVKLPRPEGHCARRRIRSLGCNPSPLCSSSQPGRQNFAAVLEEAAAASGEGDEGQGEADGLPLQAAASEASFFFLFWEWAGLGAGWGGVELGEGGRGCTRQGVIEGADACSKFTNMPLCKRSVPGAVMAPLPLAPIASPARLDLFDLLSIPVQEWTPPSTRELALELKVLLSKPRPSSTLEELVSVRRVAGEGSPMVPASACAHVGVQPLAATRERGVVAGLLPWGSLRALSTLSLATVLLPFHAFAGTWCDSCPRRLSWRTTWCSR